MKKIVEELKDYTIPLTAFRKYIEEVLNLNPDKFMNDAPNSIMVPHLINFLEKKYEIDFLDAIFYTNANTNQKPIQYNELVKKTIRVCFYKIQFGQDLMFIPF